MNYFICKKLEDCICENCLNWVAESRCGVCHARPLKEFPDKRHWCSDGQWLCQFYGHSGAVRHEVLYRGNFVEHLFYNERDAQYRAQQEKAREEFLAEAKGSTTEEQLESLFFKAGLIFDDLYKIKKELGMPLP